MDECIFCKIVAGLAPAAVVWENDDYLAFLDLFPVRRGQTLVVTKKHLDADLWNLADEDAVGLYKAGIIVSRKLRKGLGCWKVAQAMEGLQVNHAHIKLYPVYNGEVDQELIRSGEKTNPEDLKSIALLIRKEGEV